MCPVVIFSPTDKQSDQVSVLRDNTEECSTMVGSLAIQGDAAPTGVTTFANEACTGVDVMGGHTMSSLTKAQPDLQDIKSYFQRPRLVARGSVAFGTLTRLYFGATSSSSLSTVFPQWSQRLSGAYGIRYTLNVRVQFAATPFHQGLFALAAQYGGSVSPTNFDRTFRSYTVTNLPHVRVDLSEMTMAELKVPYLAATEFSPVDATDTNITSCICLTTVMPVSTVTGMNPPTYEIYYYLSDIELFGADNNQPSTITLQSGLSDFGRELKDARILSRGLSQVSKIANFAGRHIPSLQAFTGPVEWVAGTMSGVAKYFGYSKPLLQDPVVRTYRTIYASDNQVDVPAASFPIGLMQSNTLEMTKDIGATDVDEMALQYVLQQWSQICLGFISTGNVHGAVVYASPVSPSCFWFRQPTAVPYCNRSFPKNSSVSGGATTNCIMPSSLMNISSLFRMWRGSVKYRITFAKTKFHGGRFMISFNPGYTERVNNFSNFTTITGPEVVSGLTQPYGYSQIMDLRDGNVFEFTVPYMLESPYVGFCSSVGGISIVCIDPLQVTASVAVGIHFLVEVCGGDDYEVADFAGPWTAPMPSGVILTQSGEVVSATSSPSHLTVGEKIMSVKQLIQAPSWIKTNVQVGFTRGLLYPWFVSPPVDYLRLINSTPMPIGMVISGNTIASYLAKSYAFARGGTDHHLYAIGGTEDLVMVADQGASEGYFDYSDINPDLTSRLSMGVTPKVVARGELPLHLRAPAFQPYVRIPTHILDNRGIPAFGAAPTSFAATTVRGHVDRITIRNPTDLPVPIWYSKSAADDATLAHYMGPVPLVFPNAASTVRPDTDWYV